MFWGGGAVLRIRIRMDLHEFGLLDPHLDPATNKFVPKFELLMRSSILSDVKYKF